MKKYPYPNAGRRIFRGNELPAVSRRYLCTPWNTRNPLGRRFHENIFMKIFMNFMKFMNFAIFMKNFMKIFMKMFHEKNILIQT